MAIDWTYYYTQVLKNPTATPEAKARATVYLGGGASTTPAANSPVSIRNLQVGEGDQTALSLAGGQSADSASQKFGLALMQMLKQYQNPNLLGTKGIQQQQLDLSSQQAGRIAEQTPQALIGASPSQQATARGAEASALNPSIEGAGQRAKTFSEQISSFGDALTQAQAIGEWMTTQEANTRKEAQKLVLDNPDAVKSMGDKERSVLLKQAGVTQEFLDAMPSSASKETVETGTGVWQLNPKTGRYDIYIGPPKKTGEGLTDAQVNQNINGIVNAFDNEPIVKEYNTISTLYNTIIKAGNSPADDISRIYAFAKIMDPNSVVREGEYNTVQNYIMSGLQAQGIKAKRIVTNSGFLTTEARQFMEDTLKNRVLTAEQQYKNVQAEYNRRIEDAKSGKTGSLTNYGKTFNTEVPDTQLEQEYNQLKTSSGLGKYLKPQFQSNSY